MASLVFPFVGSEAFIDLPELGSEQLEVLREGLVGEALRLQRIFNLYDPKSELSQLNGERRIAASSELCSVLGAALRYAALTDGRYDVSLGRAFLARKQGKPRPALGCSYKDILLKGDRVDLRHPDVLIDLGSIAKGAMGDLLVDWLKAQGVERGYVDLRGDVVAFGDPETVAIQHPREPRATMGTFTLQDAGAATSGDYKQYWGSMDANHILGARDFASVTAVHPKLMHADAIATCLFLLGSARAGPFLASSACAGCKAFLVAKDLSARSHGLDVRPASVRVAALGAELAP